MSRFDVARASRFLLVLPSAFAPAGGLEAYDRMLVRAFGELARDRGGFCRVMLLNDNDGLIDRSCVPDRAGELQGFDRRRLSFAASVKAAWRHRPDLVVFGHVHFGPLGLALQAFCGPRRWWIIAYGIDVWRRLSLLQRLAMTRADRVVSISDYTRDALCHANGVDPDRVRVLPCAVDPGWARDHQPGSLGEIQGDVILTVTRLASTERYKGVDHVLRAVARVRATRPALKHVVIGDGDDRSRLESLARQLGLDGTVEFRGLVSPAELARAYAEAALFVMPSKKEGFGIVYLEAALFGRPSIAARAGGAPEAVEDGCTGRLVSGDDVGETAAAIETMLQDRGSLATMGRRARQRCRERFSLEQFRARLAEYVDHEADAPGTAGSMERDLRC